METFNSWFDWFNINTYHVSHESQDAAERDAKAIESDWEHVWEYFRSVLGDPK